MPRDFFPAEDLYPSETLYPSSCWKEAQALFDVLLHSLISGKSDIQLHNLIAGKNDILIHDLLASKADVLLAPSAFSAKFDVLLHGEISGLFDIILIDELVSKYDLQLLIPELEATYGIAELPWNKSDFITLLNEMGDELKCTTCDFKGIFVRLKATKSLPDSIDLPAGAGIVYVDPVLTLNENDLIKRKGRKYQLKSQELVKYIGANPIYRVLGLEEYMPWIEFSCMYDLTLTAIAKDLESLYGIVWPVAAEVDALYEIQRNIVSRDLANLYDVIKILAQVSGLRAVPDASQNIWTYWNPTEDEDKDYYKVHRSTVQGFTPSDANLVALPTTNSRQHKDLVASTPYYFRVCAVSKLGIEGTYSAEVSATTSA